jgi:hypothetical protein
MTFLTKQNYKWVIIILFLGIIVGPSQIPSPTFKSLILAVFGGGALFFELLSLRSLKKTDEKFQTNFRQTMLLIVLTVLLLVVNFVL